MQLEGMKREVVLSHMAAVFKADHSLLDFI